MFIYKFSTFDKEKGKLFSIQKLEVDEKPKLYIGFRKRIKKSEINELSHTYGNAMYRLDDNPRPYIEAMIKRKTELTERAERQLAYAKAELEKWTTLAEGESNEG